MSLFKDTLDSHNKILEEKKNQETLQQSEEIDKKKSFLQDFIKSIEDIAMPILDKFSNDANDSGYASKVKVVLDNEKDMAIYLYLIPEKDVLFGVSADTESVFAIKANPEKLKTDFVSYFDQRSNRSAKTGKRTDDYLGTKSINQETIERLLKNFLRDALQARGNA